MVKILMTGFEPFGGDDENVTGILTNSINGRVVNGAELIGRVLPVSYSRAKAELIDLFHIVKPDVYVGMGLSPGSAMISVEKVALNIANGKDNDNVDASDESVISDGPPAYFSTLPVRSIVESLRRASIPVRESYHAGTYLCNYVMYIGLHAAAVEGIPRVAGFIHFPYNSEYIVKRGSNAPSLPISLMINAVIRSVDVIIEELIGNPYRGTT